MIGPDAQTLQVTFSGEMAVLESGQVKEQGSSRPILTDLSKIADQNLIIGSMSREPMGDYIYYRFLYYDRKTSKQVRLKVVNSEPNRQTIQTIESIRTELLSRIETGLTQRELPDEPSDKGIN